MEPTDEIYEISKKIVLQNPDSDDDWFEVDDNWDVNAWQDATNKARGTIYHVVAGSTDTTKGWIVL